MAAQQGIKRRIKSVSNTKQITKAMQLVAASKLRKAQEEALGPKDYISASQGLLATLSATPEAQYHPLFIVRKVKNALSIVVTSDKGLAGAYNNNVSKNHLKKVLELGVPQQVICIGRYAAMHVARIKELEELSAYDLDHGDADIVLAKPVLSEALELFLTGEVDIVTISYTKFISTIKQEAVTEVLLPFQKPENQTPVGRTFEPGVQILLDKVVKRLLEAQVLQAILESRASEHASRMLAMKNATDNASDLIEDLTLAFNNARQASITQELAEITAGAEAING